MVVLEFRSRRGRVVVDDAGIEVVASGAAPFLVRWHAIGHIELGYDAGCGRVILVHLADGRTVPLPAPDARRADESFDLAAAQIFRAWRHYTRERIREPHDEIPSAYRAGEAARALEPVQDATPPADMPGTDARALDSVQDAAPAGMSSLLHWVRRRVGGG